MMITKQDLMCGQVYLNTTNGKVVRILYNHLGDENTTCVQFHGGGCGSMPIRYLRKATPLEISNNPFSS